MNLEWGVQTSIKERAFKRHGSKFLKMACATPLLTRTFALNKSWSKKIMVGLEFEDISDQRFKPTVRLLSKDFEGISFDMENWKNFQAIFEDIDQYLRGEKNLEEQRYNG